MGVFFLFIPLLAYNPGTSFRNWGAFAAVKTDGSVITLGHSWYGGDSSSVSLNIASGVVAVYSTTCAFAALKTDGSVITWGCSQNGGEACVYICRQHSAGAVIPRRKRGIYSAVS